MRTRRIWSALVGVSLLSVVLAAGVTTTAHAATGVTITLDTDRLTVTARPGVANQLDVTKETTRVIVRDTADIVVPGPCTRLGDHVVSCPLRDDVWIDAGDGDDTVRYTRGTLWGQGFLSGAAGNDSLTVVGRGGFTTLAGGRGADILVGGDGFDLLYGDEDNDLLEGGAHNDWLRGGPGTDVLSGGSGIDEASYAERTLPVTVDLDGVADDGALHEGDNVHTDVEGVFGGAGADHLIGNAVDNALDGNGGNDIVDGRGGNDQLEGGKGDDAILGGDGDDRSSQTSLGEDQEDGHDTFWGGPGSDTVSYSGRSLRVLVDLDGVADDGSPANGEKDNAIGVENVGGGYEHDVLIGNAADNDLYGDQGSDLLRGGGGRDTLDGGEGPDDLWGEDGDDVLDDLSGDDYLDGGTGQDLVDGGPGNDGQWGGEGNDTLRSPGPIKWADELEPDNDHLDGGPGTDAVSYSTRTHPVRADLDGDADDGYAAGGERDRILTTIENLAGGAGDDTLVGNANVRNQLLGLSGNDTLDARDGVGNDFVDGGVGADSCLGDAGDVRANCSP